MGVTFEQLTGDLTGVNFSSIRAGLVEFRREIEQTQHSFITFQFCQPVWNAFLRSAILAGKLDAPDFFRDPMAFTMARHIPPGFDYVDPLKDVQAQKLAIRNGIMSRNEAVGQWGRPATAFTLGSVCCPQHVHWYQSVWIIYGVAVQPNGERICCVELRERFLHTFWLAEPALLPEPFQVIIPSVQAPT